jgi:SAM-dependent methyltransferase
MRKLNRKAAFDAAFCFGNSFGYLDHVAAPAFLQAVAAALKPGGRLSIETGMAAESILPSLQPRGWFQLGDILMLSERRYVAEDSRLDIDYTFIRGNVVETRPSASYAFTVAELRRMLSGAGIEPVATLGSTAGEPYKLGSPRLILVGRKA